MEPLPLPLRLAAGLVATAIEEVQALPKKLIELPVTAVSSVLQTSMRVQQRVTELAIKGDQALGGLREVPETPTWARFDEDELDDGPFGGGQYSGGQYGGGAGYDGGGANGYAAPTFDEDWDLPRPGARTVSPILVTREPAPPAADVEPSDPTPEADATTDTDAGGPAGLEAYGGWSLPQLRGRFRSLSLEQLQALLDWETSHRNRAPYLTMLSNRVASVTGR
jgi:hypothetical protein